MNEIVQRTELPNGITVLTLHLPNRLSVACGIWIKAGSRYDPTELQGIAHYTEHMLFKGTKNRTSREISDTIEGVGGSIDGYTSFDVTTFYTKLLSKDIALGMDVLTEMVTQPLLDQELFDREKKIIAEEIAADLDDPQTRSFSRMSEILWEDQTLAHSILGTKESLEKITLDDIKDFIAKHYVPGNIIAACTGDVDHDEFVEIVQKKFTSLNSESKVPEMVKNYPTNLGKLHLIPDNIGQAYIYIISPVGAINGKLRYTLALLSLIMGGGSSSRLFQSLREKSGLAYYVSTGTEHFVDGSVLISNADVNGSSCQQSIEIILNEMREFAEGNLSDKELERAKNTVSGKLALSAESTSDMLHRLTSNEMIIGEFSKLDESIRRFQAVSKEDIAELSRRIFAPENMMIFIYGNVPEKIDIEGLETIWHKKKE